MLFSCFSFPGVKVLTDEVKSKTWPPEHPPVRFEELWDENGDAVP